MSIIPASRPKLDEREARHLLDLNGVPALGCAVMLLAVRAYRRDSMGAPGVNDTGIYDDALFLVGPHIFRAYNANVDPVRIGWNPGVGKPFAQLVPGVWPFVKGLHKGRYAALRQPYEDQAVERDLATIFDRPDDPRALGHFTVRRTYTDKAGKTHSYEDTGYHAINIHRGGTNGTSSWGCITIPPLEYAEFQPAVYSAMEAANQKWIPCSLLTGPLT